MARFNVNISRYSVMATALCVGFLLIVISSLRLIPDSVSNKTKETSSQQVITEQQKIIEETQEENKSDNSLQQEEQIKNPDLAQNIDNISNNSIPKLEVIGNDTAVISAEKSLYSEAERLVKEEKFESAVYEYQKIAESSADNSIKANCYQQIATIYGGIKRYGTALAFAQKSYNILPTTERELLLARLYYKTGNGENAEKHINAILERDLSADKK